MAWSFIYLTRCTILFFSHFYFMTLYLHPVTCVCTLRDFLYSSSNPYTHSFFFLFFYLLLLSTKANSLYVRTYLVINFILIVYHNNITGITQTNMDIFLCASASCPVIDSILGHLKQSFSK